MYLHQQYSLRRIGWRTRNTLPVQASTSSLKRNYARGRPHVVTWGEQNLHTAQRDAWTLHFFPKKAISTLLSATEVCIIRLKKLLNVFRPQRLVRGHERRVNESLLGCTLLASLLAFALTAMRVQLSVCFCLP